MRNYFYVAVIAVAALLLVVSIRTIFAFQGPTAAPPNDNGLLAADDDNVGIGTESPDARLHVKEKDASVELLLDYGASWGQFSLGESGDRKWGIGSHKSNDNFYIYDYAATGGGQYVFEIDNASGDAAFLKKLSIGTTSPSSKLEIADNSTAVKMAFKRIDNSINGGNALGRIIFTGTDGGSEANPRVGSYIQGTARETWDSDQSPGDLSFYTTPEGSTVSSNRMRIDESGLVEIMGQLKIKGGSPVRGKFLKAGTDGGKAEWDYLPGDHLWGQGRPGVVVKNTSGECVKGGLKISRSIPSVRWEGAAASCPKGWWVCTAAERTTDSCGTDTYTIKGCYSNYTNYGSSISAPTVYFYKQGASHLNELSAGTIWTFGFETTFWNGVFEQEGVINAWVADAYNYPSTGVSGKSVSINGNTSEGAVCEKYPVWCCANN